MKKYFLNVTYYDYKGNILGMGYCIGGYDTYEEALKQFASYTSINDFQGVSDGSYYIVLSIDTEEECNLKSRKFEEA